MPTKQNISAKFFSKFWIFFFLIVCVISVVWFSYPFILNYYFLNSFEISETSIIYSQMKGAFGDQFGSLSALFSGLAFAGVIYTILLQRKDLIATRKEVERQNKISEKQIFETTLFQMLFSRQDILKDLDILGDKGRKALSNYFAKIVSNDNDFPFFKSFEKLDRDQIRELKETRVINDYCKANLQAKHLSTIQECLEERPVAIDAYLDAEDAQLRKLKLASTKATMECMDELSHYIRYTFWIYNIIAKNESFSDAEKSDYANIVRSQLSDVEVATIFYSIIVSEDSVQWSNDPVSAKQMKELALRFKIVDNINDRFLIHSDHKKFLKR